MPALSRSPSKMQRPSVGQESDKPKPKQTNSTALLNDSNSAHSSQSGCKMSTGSWAIDVDRKHSWAIGFRL
ncbi:hypothetical protein [Candidatus Nitrotoga sp. 1052]|uniref:hypothetical protein n=1 Tax=Candidatus Nitrotoga sp. 1052 TaxID=2886964 RepID=UPI001EF43E92|nr:hypothetical protein [Candidatus Nitrotoga sp. 1052]CAH1073329.1 hypothetical protein NTG1052_20054 [Candidatus Nitrotoga sp. 1052]